MQCTVFHLVYELGRVKEEGGVNLVTILTINQVADLLKVPKSTVYRLVRDHQLPGHKVGKHWRFVESEVEAWICEQHGSDEQL